MNEFKTTVSTAIVLLLAIVACSAPNGSSGTESNGPTEPNAVTPEIPAPMRQSGKSFAYKTSKS